MNVGLLGCGHIAKALVRGWVRTEVAVAFDAQPASVRPKLFLYDVASAPAAELADLAGGQVVDSVAELVVASDLIVLAVRPQDAALALATLAPVLGDRPVVSLAAGIKVGTLKAQLPQGASVGRLMPNLNVAVGMGAMLFAEGSLGRHAPAVREVFALVGKVVTLDEALFDAATAVAGCGPGFVALFIEALEAAGSEAGLPPAVSRELAQAAFTGTSLMVQAEGDAGALKRAICSPGGMTAAGIAALEERAVPAAIAAAVQAAVARAKELAS